MSEETKTSGKGWTDEEKLGVLFQIIEKTCDKIPWGEIVLPEGRTKKAVSVMVDKEKAKVRKVKEAAAAAAAGASSGGENGEDSVEPKTPSSKGKKRDSKAAIDAAGEGDEDEMTPKAKKSKATPRKKKATQSKVKVEEEANAVESGEGAVKDEDDGLE